MTELSSSCRDTEVTHQLGRVLAGGFTEDTTIELSLQDESSGSKMTRARKRAPGTGNLASQCMRESRVQKPGNRPLG